MIPFTSFLTKQHMMEYIIDNNMQGIVQKAKIVFLGDMSVGKTSIINRFALDSFSGSQAPTVGVDFISKTVKADNNKTIRLQLWDTAGQDRFHSLIPSYIRDSHAAIIIYDVTNEVSYNNLNKWVEDVRDVIGEEAVIFILGNKMDRVSDRVVERKIAEAKTQQLKIDFFQVSAKEGTGIKEFFAHMTERLSGGIGTKRSTITTIEAIDFQKQKGTGLVNPNLTNPEKRRRKGCC